MSPGSVADDRAQPNAVDEISIFFDRAGLVIFMVQIGIRRRVLFKKPCGEKQNKQAKKVNKVNTILKIYSLFH